MVHMPTPEEIEALKKALSDALGEVRVLRTERDLLKEQLPASLADQVQAELEAEAPAALAAIVAAVIERQLERRRGR